LVYIFTLQSCTESSLPLYNTGKKYTLFVPLSLLFTSCQKPHQPDGGLSLVRISLDGFRSKISVPVTSKCDVV